MSWSIITRRPARVRRGPGSGHERRPQRPAGVRSARPRPLVVTEHRAHDCRCADCGAQTRAPFPEAVNAPCSTARGSARSYSISCTTSCCREASGRVDGRSPRGDAGGRDHRPDQPGLCPALSRLRKCGAGSHRRGAGQAHGRDRLSDRRQDAMAACRLHGAADLLSRLHQARQPFGECRRHRRPRSLEALLHHAGRAARLVQRPSPARAEGARRDRERGVGAQNATAPAPRLSRGRISHANEEGRRSRL